MERREFRNRSFREYRLPEGLCAWQTLEGLLFFQNLLFFFTGDLGLATRAGGRAKKGKKQTPHDDPGPYNGPEKRESCAEMLGNEALVAFGSP